MANAVLTVTEFFDPLVHDLTPEEVLGKALGGAIDGVRSVVGAPLIVAQASTDTAAALTLVDLTAQGVTFPAGFYRTVQADIFSRNSANSEIGWKRVVALVVGGSTPAVIAAGGAGSAGSPPQPNGLQTVINAASAGLDDVLVAAINVQTANVCVQLVTVPAAEFRHRCEVTVGPLIQINDVNT